MKKKELILVSSITHAIKGRDILSTGGIKAYIERTPGHLDTVGCGYSIFVNGDTDAAEKMLRENNIKILGRTGGGTT